MTKKKSNGYFLSLLLLPFNPFIFNRENSFEYKNKTAYDYYNIKKRYCNKVEKI